VIRGLALHEIQVRWLKQVWRHPNRDAAAARWPDAWDGPLVRLARVDPGPTLVVQPTGYFDVLASNLDPHASGPMADPIGINGWVTTPDGRVLLQRRHAHLAWRPSQLCPGFSGSLEPRDLPAGPLSRADLLRELREELGPLPVLGSPTILGLVREPERRGIPDLFVHVRVADTRALLRPGPEGAPLFWTPGAPLTGTVSPPLRTMLALSR
jgi:hypothetical protein